MGQSGWRSLGNFDVPCTDMTYSLVNFSDMCRRADVSQHILSVFQTRFPHVDVFAAELARYFYSATLGAYTRLQVDRLVEIGLLCSGRAKLGLWTCLVVKITPR